MPSISTNVSVFFLTPQILLHSLFIRSITLFDEDHPVVFDRFAYKDGLKEMSDDQCSQLAQHVQRPLQVDQERPRLMPCCPRSTVTDSVYGRKRSYTESYTTVYMPYTLRIRPYFAIKHVIVLRSYMSVTVYDEIRRNMETVSDRIFPLYGRKWTYTGKPRYTDRDFLPYWNHKPFYQASHETGSISDAASLPTPSIRSNSSIKTNRSKRKKLN
jgi:hypothetical protein